MNVILGKRCCLFSKKRCEVTVIISNFTKLKVEQKVPVCTQMVENTSIICFLPFWKKANRVELPCILRVILWRLVFMERWWAYTIQMATVCYMYFCDNNVSHSGTDLLTDVLLNDTYSGNILWQWLRWRTAGSDDIVNDQVIFTNSPWEKSVQFQ